MTFRTRTCAVAGLAFSIVLSGAASEEPRPDAPLGLSPVPIPADNPSTAQNVVLGKRLYFDPRLSRDGTISCATCHNPRTGWTERRPTSQPVNGARPTRNQIQGDDSTKLNPTKARIPARLPAMLTV